MHMLTQFRRLIMLTCQDVNEFLVAYLDGELPARLGRRFEKHVARCAQCTAYLGQYRRTIELAREEGQAVGDPPEELIEMTLAFLRDRLGESQ